MLAGAVQDGQRMAFTGGYTVIEELTSELRLYSYYVRWWPGLALYWTHSEPGQRYRVEWTRALGADQWQILSPETEYPVVEQWSSRMIFLDMRRHPGGYYRLRVDPIP